MKNDELINKAKEIAKFHDLQDMKKLVACIKELRLNINRESVDEVPCSDRVMPARVEEEQETYCIYISEGVYVQRKRIASATDNPLTIQEELINKLCKTILGQQA